MILYLKIRLIDLQTDLNMISTKLTNVKALCLTKKQAQRVQSKIEEIDCQINLLTIAKRNIDRAQQTMDQIEAQILIESANDIISRVHRPIF